MPKEKFLECLMDVAEDMISRKYKRRKEKIIREVKDLIYQDRDFSVKNLLTDNKIQQTMGFFDCSKYNQVSIEQRNIFEKYRNMARKVDIKMKK